MTLHQNWQASACTTCLELQTGWRKTGSRMGCIWLRSHYCAHVLGGFDNLVSYPLDYSWYGSFQDIGPSPLLSCDTWEAPLKLLPGVLLLSILPILLEYLNSRLCSCLLLLHASKICLTSFWGVGKVTNIETPKLTHSLPDLVNSCSGNDTHPGVFLVLTATTLKWLWAAF